jgi:hypothetical protein
MVYITGALYVCVDSKYMYSQRESDVHISTRSSTRSYTQTLRSKNACNPISQPQQSQGAEVWGWMRLVSSHYFMTCLDFTCHPPTHLPKPRCFSRTRRLSGYLSVTLLGVNIEPCTHVNNACQPQPRSLEMPLARFPAA